jgi:hypothetical protein
MARLFVGPRAGPARWRSDRELCRLHSASVELVSHVRTLGPSFGRPFLFVRKMAQPAKHQDRLRQPRSAWRSDPASRGSAARRIGFHDLIRGDKAQAEFVLYAGGEPGAENEARTPERGNRKALVICLSSPPFHKLRFIAWGGRRCAKIAPITQKPRICVGG